MWVFAYGSLLWNPGFDPEESQLAHVTGFHRSFSMLSVHHRGTEQTPGLVLALSEAANAHCTGIAMKVRAREQNRVLEMLRERELVSAAYLEHMLDLHLRDGRIVRGLTYVIDPNHRQFVDFDLETQARMIARAHGDRGPNREYLLNTADQLVQMGINDADIAWLAQRVQQNDVK